MSTSNTPLSQWLRAATQVERERLAALSGTETNYLYQLASCRREPKVGLAFAIETATKQMHEESFGRLPVVTALDLATMCAIEGLPG